MKFGHSPWWKITEGIVGFHSFDEQLRNVMNRAATGYRRSFVYLVSARLNFTASAIRLTVDHQKRKRKQHQLAIERTN
jgi:hypothetical protein